MLYFWILLKIQEIFLIISKYRGRKKLPDVDYKESRSRKRHRDKDADDALENPEPRNKFRIKAVIPVMGGL